jgi:hypothetical protein
MAQSKNRILNALPQNIYAAVEPHLKQMELIFGAVVAETDQAVDRVYFPDAGVISLVVEMEVGDMIETAMVGRDGVVNGTSALDGKVALHKGIVQVAGVASVTSSDVLRSLAGECGPLRGMLIRMSRCCSRRHSNRPAATPVTQWKHACAGGCCASAI